MTPTPPAPSPDAAVAAALGVAALALARRFAAGATLWCAALPWPSHGRHVAVEFVHPVIVGKRALPARSVPAEDPVAGLRLLARPGDVLLAVAPAADDRTADLLRRAETWGLLRLWLGAGPRPAPDAPGHADHIVWLDHDDPAVAARSGRVVLLYHLLWELAHAVFEHPGALAVPEEAPVCVTCRDEARPAEVRRVTPDGALEVVVDGRVQVVDGTLVGPAVPGDLLLVHAGVALGPAAGGGDPR